MARFRISGTGVCTLTAHISGPDAALVDDTEGRTGDAICKVVEARREELA
jgi:hypothetical protein